VIFKKRNKRLKDIFDIFDRLTCRLLCCKRIGCSAASVHSEGFHLVALLPVWVCPLTFVE
jgi:hypothetical protein